MSARHLPALDVVRVLTVGLVISVHTVSFQPGGVGWSNGAVLMVAHVSREVFFLLTAFVLTYAHRDREVRWRAFWRRRYLLIGVPYLVWSTIYVLVAGRLSDLPIAVLTGTAWYHLYFLLVSMQLYLVFPVLRWVLRVVDHRILLPAAVVYQVAAYVILPHLIAQPDALLPTYLGFVVVGGVAAGHADALLGFTGRHSRLILFGCADVLLAALVWFFVAGRDPSDASRVFQPLIVVESLAVAWAFLALGLCWKSRWFRIGADVSFGVYLAHPLLLQGVLAVVTWPAFATTAFSLLVVVPAIYLTCAVAVWALRRTPVSLPLTGHPPVPVLNGGLRCERQTA